ncbi:cation:proton antiporter [Nocardioides bigeumensis]|uniref:cation:proton antiporter n=1 Tax=Nocardioides bigeumensis TaxID=433657 RepID=UPI0031DC57AF
MESAFTSLFWILLAAAVAPLVAALVPRRLVPEVVLLLALGVMIGPFVADLAGTETSVELLRELGLAMLFLLAGFEIEPSELSGRAGRVALGTWLTCLALAFGVVGLLAAAGQLVNEVAVAIALTSTALGTLLPILKDQSILGTPVGAAVLRHGAYGELGPIVAIAILLGTRGALKSLLVLAAFALVAVVLALAPLQLRRGTSRLGSLVRQGADTTGQTTVRMTMLMLVTLITVAEVFDLDIVLAAFAAGFILRLAVPEGNHHLEQKIEGIAFGLLVPVFFVTSGMAIDPDAITSHPGELALVVLLIIAIRGVPVFLASRLLRRPPLGSRESVAVGSFAATGLPIIVAVTSVSLDAGQMTSDNASLLVSAGALTVLICPLLATVVLRREPAPTSTPGLPG